MRRNTKRGKARAVNPARTGWADQWQPAGPVTITKIEVKKCPVCGNFLKKRDGKFGEFYGCESYPKCQYIEKINNSKRV